MSNTKEIEIFSDIEIIQKILHGEGALFEILIRRNNPFIYKIGRSYGYGIEDTHDLVQETFISAYINLSKFENRSTFKTWIIKIMLNNCFQKQQKFSLKKEIINTNLINEKSKPMYSGHQLADANKTVINRELRHVIENLLEQVPIEYRMVFSLREMAGLNVAETAEVMNISESNVKVRLNRAKSMLRKEIGKIYTAEDIFEFNLEHCAVNSVMSKIKTLK